MIANVHPCNGSITWYFRYFPFRRGDLHIFKYIWSPCRIGDSKAQIPFALIYCWAISYLLSCQRTFFGWELKFRGCGCHFGLWVHQKRAGREYQNLSRQQLADKIFPSNEWQHTDKPRIFSSDDWQQLSVSSWLYSVVIFTQTVSVREKSLLET